MDLSFTKEDLAFQKEVRDWIGENYTDELKARNAMSKNGYLDKDGMLEWQRKLDEKGWFVANWPEEFGGPGLSAGQRYILNMEMAAAGTPQMSPMGKSMVAPVIMAFGNDAQKAEHLPKIKRSEIWWCQGYSEPGSGSDLASLQMSAVRDGDEYVLNGSKIWTTQAQWADWIFCLVRTSKEGKPQEGISFLIFPMDLPGITASSLPTLDGPTDNQQEINQVFFEDVRVKIDEALIGEENKGWTIAKYLLVHERSGIACVGDALASLDHLKHIASDQKKDGKALAEDPFFAARMAQIEIDISAMRTTNMRVQQAGMEGKEIGPQVSQLKITGTVLRQSINDLTRRALGPYAMPFVSEALEGGSNAETFGPAYANPLAADYFNHRKTSIYGGSNEIQRNIIAKMTMG